MSGSDAAKNIVAIENEILTLIQFDIFGNMQQTSDMKVLSSVWALKEKRYPDGCINKIKVKYCARGFEQEEGVDYLEISIQL